MDPQVALDTWIRTGSKESRDSYNEWRKGKGFKAIATLIDSEESIEVDWIFDGSAAEYEDDEGCHRIRRMYLKGYEGE